MRTCTGFPSPSSAASCPSLCCHIAILGPTLLSMPTCHHHGILPRPESVTRRGEPERRQWHCCWARFSLRGAWWAHRLGWGTLVTGSALHGGKRNPAGIWPGSPDLSLSYCPLLPGTQHTWIRTQNAARLGEGAWHVLPAADPWNSLQWGLSSRAAASEGDSEGSSPSQTHGKCGDLDLDASSPAPSSMETTRAPLKVTGSTQSQVLQFKGDNTLYSKTSNRLSINQHHRAAANADTTGRGSLPAGGREAAEPWREEGPRGAAEELKGSPALLPPDVPWAHAPGRLRVKPGRAGVRVTCFPFRLPTPGTDVLSFKTASGANIYSSG